MTQYINKDALVTKIKKLEKTLKNACEPNPFGNMEECMTATELEVLDVVKETINTLEVKEVNEVPATVMVNKYGNRFISSWPGLKEYDGLKEGEEIKVVIPKK